MSKYDTLMRKYFSTRDSLCLAQERHDKARDKLREPTAKPPPLRPAKLSDIVEDALIFSRHSDGEYSPLVVDEVYGPVYLGYGRGYEAGFLSNGGSRWSTYAPDGTFPRWFVQLEYEDVDGNTLRRTK